MFNSSHVSRVTTKVQAGTLPRDQQQGACLPSVTGVVDDMLNTSGVQLGPDTCEAENVPLPESSDEKPSHALEGLDDHLYEEEMDVVVESTEELICPLMEQVNTVSNHLTEIRFTLLNTVAGHFRY